MEDGALLVKSQSLEVDSELKLPLLDFSRKEFNKTLFKPTDLNFTTTKKNFKEKKLKLKNLKDKNLTLKDIIHLESSYHSKFFSLHSSLVFVLTVLFASVQLPIYRKITNFILNESSIELFKSEILNEVLIYCWRSQAVLILGFLYLLGMYFFFSKKININGKDNENNFEFLTFHIGKVNWRSLFSSQSLKLGIANLFSNGLLFYSTKYLTCGLTSLSSNMGILIVFLVNFGTTDYIFKKEIIDRTIRAIVGFLSAFGLILLFYPVLDFKTLIGIYLCVGSLIINSLFVKPMTAEYFKTYSPFEVFIILYLNTFIFTVLVILILQTIFYEINFFLLFGWLADLSVFEGVIIMGLTGLLYMASVISVSVYLKPPQISALKYIETPFSDLFASFVLGIYSSPFSVYYILGLFQIFTGMFLVDLFHYTTKLG